MGRVVSTLSSKLCMCLIEIDIYICVSYNLQCCILHLCMSSLPCPPVFGAVIFLSIAGSESSHALCTGLASQQTPFVGSHADSGSLFTKCCCAFEMQALSPAMEQWRKRISKIAASFEANKAEISTAEKQTKSTNKSLKPEVTATGPKPCVSQGKFYSQDLQLQNKLHVFSESACLTLAVL